MITSNAVFISYSRADSDFIRRLYSGLQARGYESWVDWEDIEPTTEWWQAIQNGIEAADNFLFVISPDSISSPICNLELEYACQNNKRIIPLYLRDTDEAQAFGQLAARQLTDFTEGLIAGREVLLIARQNWNILSAHQRLDFTNADKFDSQVGVLVETLQKDFEHVRNHTRWGLRAREWSQAGQPEHALLRGGDILAAEQWLAESEARKPSATAVQRQYIEASRRAEERRKAEEALIARRVRNFQRATVILLVVFVLALVAVVAAVLQIRDAQNERDDSNALGTWVAFEATFFSDQQNLNQTLIPGVGIVPTRAASLEPPSFYATATQLARLSAWEPVVDETYLAEYGIEMVQVPAGCFIMGTYTGDTDEAPAHEICFDAPFWIDRYEVTNGQFAALDGQAEKESCRSQEADHPRDCISWLEARDFCAARDARLPTEAEWEYAARGPASLAYPWGSERDPANVVYVQNAESSTAMVGSRPGGMSWVGAHDFSGNVWEWTNTIYREYPYSKDDGREIMTDTDSHRVLRGGSWSNNILDVRSAYRQRLDSDYNNSDRTGFRCAR